MSTSKFSNPFMMKNPLSPLKGNAFIKAVKEAKDNNKTSFSFNGKNYPLKMEAESPVNSNHNEDPKKIIGEQTYEFEQDKPSGNYVAGLSLDISESAQPSDTDDRLVITPEQKKKMEKDGDFEDSPNNNYIKTMKKMTVKKDSVSGGKNFYSIKK